MIMVQLIVKIMKNNQNPKKLTKGFKMRFTNNIGFLLLAIYLILVGLITIIPSIVIPGIVLGILALISGIFILIGR